MWLINAHNYAREHFEVSHIPPYAILSHRWRDREITFHDPIHPDLRGESKYDKVFSCCAQAVSHGLDHVWIDTCCIDRTNSAELSETINSMLIWYRAAEICYAYLDDVQDASIEELSQSKWFTRGWTLQELLAPRKLEIYNSHWTFMGTRFDLCETISKVTGIPPYTLRADLFTGHLYSVADKMSWAAERVTTRREDRAYSLLGLFGVNMPLIYGEGRRSVTRLQKEILQTTADLTIFAWRDIPGWGMGPLAGGIHGFNHGKGSLRSWSYLECPELVNQDPAAGYTSEGALFSSVGLTITLYLVPLAYAGYLVPIAREDTGRDPFSGQRRALGETWCMVIQRDNRNGHYRRIYLAGEVLVKLHGTTDLRTGKFQRVVLIGPTTKPAGWSAIAPSIKFQFGFDVVHLEKLAATELHNLNDQSGKLEAMPGFEIISRDVLSNQSSYLSMPKHVPGIAGMIQLTSNAVATFIIFGFEFVFSPMTSWGWPRSHI